MKKNKGTIENLFLDLGYNWQEMPENIPINVSNKNCQILSFDLKTKKKVWKRILNIIYKGQQERYRVISSYLGGNTDFDCTKDHLIAICKLNDVQTFHIEKDKILSINVNKEIFHQRENSKLPNYTIKDMKEICFDTIENCYYCYLRDKKPLNGISLKKELVNSTFTIEKYPDETIPVLDLEVEDTHCYFTDGILSHNTMFGNPETTTSGEALKFYSSQRLEMRSKGPIGEGEKIGIKTKAKVVKNKIAAPYKETEFSILFGSGVDFVGDLFQTATDKGIITKDKNTYLIGENKLAVGEGAAIEALRASPDFQKQILDKLSASRHNK